MHKRTGLCWATAEQLLRSTLTIVPQLWRKFFRSRAKSSQREIKLSLIRVNPYRE